ncbi:MAG: hypothetical protein GXP14_15765 [Gammaproteobacteria bacterium]|nr:hypothetical protein [Gammaproteobacteria bacterium]
MLMLRGGVSRAKIHDFTDANAYFILVDVDPNYMAASGYSLQTFYKNIARIPVRDVTIALFT